MAKGKAPVESREERKRELLEAEKALKATVAEYVAAEVAATDASDPGRHPALLDERIRQYVEEAVRRGVESALAGNSADREGCRGSPPLGKPRTKRAK